MAESRRETVIVNSDDSNSSFDTSSSNTLPPKLTKTSTSTKYRKGTHKPKERKGQWKSKERKHVTLSCGSHASTTSPDSEHVTQKRHVRQNNTHESSHKARHSNRACKQDNEGLFEIFQKHYSNLVKIIQTCPEPIANQLFARKIIPANVLNEVITGQDSQVKKASVLLVNVSSVLEVNPEKMLEFIEVLKAEPSFAGITKDILGDIEDAKRLLQRQAVQKTSVVPSPKMPPAFSTYRKYLQSYYQKNSVRPDDKLSIVPCNEFINLALVQKGLGSKVPLEMDSILTSNSQFVLVEGPPGIGKSTLCWELCRKWDTLKSLKDYRIVLQLKLRERRVQNATSLNDIFYHDDKRLCDSVVDEVFKCDGEGVLVIFDGFDEIPTSVVRKKSDLIMRLINGECLPRATRLVTSRPSALHHFPQVYRRVEILGFTDEHKVQYAEKAFKSEPDVFTHFKNFIFSNPVIKSLMYIPVNCAITAQVYKDIRRSRKLMPKTMTQLYSTLTLVHIRRHMIENCEWDEHSRISNNLKDLPAEISTKLKKVSELAYRGLFNEDGVQLVFTDSDIVQGFQHLGLLSESKEMYVCEGTKTTYSFLHLSIQEFLAAWHVSCHHELADKVIPTIFCEDMTLTVKSHLNTFGQFLAGLLGCDYFYSAIPIFSGFLMYYIHCFYEAQESGNPTNTEYLLKFSSHFNIVSLSLFTPLDMYVFGYTLVHVPVKWCLIVDTSLDMLTLASSLADHTPSGAEILGSIVELDLSGAYTLPWKRSSLSIPKQLPQSLRENIVKIYVDIVNIPLMFLQIGSLLPNLKSFSLTVREQCQDDYLLYQVLKNISGLKTLSLRFRLNGTTTKGIQELCDIIACSRTLECVTLKLSDDNLTFYTRHVLHYEYFMVAYCELQKLAQAVLSCSSVKSLTTNFPFTTPTSLIPRNIELIKLEFGPITLSSGRGVPVTVVGIENYLCYMANMCKIPSMRFLVIELFTYFRFIPTKSFCNFLAILNVSLHHNPAMERVIIYSRILDCIYCTASELSHALCQSPGIPQLHLRRSMSLCDLTVDYYDEPQRFRSCPDLLEIQSLHNIHPLLYEAMECHKYYWKNNSYTHASHASILRKW